MTLEAFEWSDWQAVIAAHPLESHDPVEWLRYGVALLYTIEPGPEQGRQQQQAALAFLQAEKEGASEQEVKQAQQKALSLSLIEVSRIAGLSLGGERTAKPPFAASDIPKL